MSGTKEEAVGYVFMDLSSPRMLPCSLDTSFKKDIGGLQYDIRGRAGGKKSTAPAPHTHTPSAPLSASTSRLCPAPGLDTNMETLLHLPSLPWWLFLIPHLSFSLLLPSLPVASCQSTLFLSFPSPVASCNNAFISLLSVKSVSSIVCKF